MTLSNGMTADRAEKLGYTDVKMLSNGEFAGVMPMILTVGLFIGIGPISYRTRYCYPDLLSARAAIREWDGVGDPPGPWIKQKPEDRSNPNPRTPD
jgi:hypothetical protein